jgi:hypothetical protein
MQMLRLGAILAGLLAALPCVALSQPQQSPPGAVQQVAPGQAMAILGQQVADASGKALGRLVDVLVDSSGTPQAAVIDFGGFLGVGSRRVAVHWSALHFTPGDPKRGITLDLTPGQIKDAPEYSDTTRAAPVVTAAPAAAAPYPPSSLPADSGVQGSKVQGSGKQGSGAQGSGAQGSEAQGSEAQGSEAQGSEAQGSEAQGSKAQGSGALGR